MNQEAHQNRQSMTDSFLYPEREQNKCLKFLRKFDFFSFIPVPKDQPVSTRRSIFGSCIFILLFLLYIVVDLVQFIQENPPLVQNAQSTLDDNFYSLPRTAIAFMEGQALNITKDYDQFISYTLTKQLKDNSIKLATQIPMQINNQTYLSEWLGNKTINFYQKLYSPSQQMFARGLLYSTQNANYTKITINLCDLNQVNNTCQTFDNIASLMAKGRIFLFIQQMQDQTGVSNQNTRPNKFRIANFFLIPRLYKRITVEYQVIKTVVFPDYFHHFTTRNFTRLQLYSISEQSSDTSINDKQQGRQSLQMLGITFQLAAQVIDVRVVYVTLLDHVAKWGAFFNVLFAIFAICFLAYNQEKFYKRNPDWERFRNRHKSVINTVNTSQNIAKEKFSPQ